MLKQPGLLGCLRRPYQFPRPPRSPHRRGARRPRCLSRHPRHLASGSAASGRAWGLMWESPDIWRPSCCGRSRRGIGLVTPSCYGRSHRGLGLASPSCYGRSRRGLGLISPSCVAALAAASGSSAPPAVAAPAAASGSLAPSPASLRPRSPPLQPTPPRGVSSAGAGVAARHGSPAVGVTGATTTPGCSQACGAFASSSTNLIDKYRRSHCRCAPRVSGQAGCFWARDASPTPSGL